MKTVYFIGGLGADKRAFSFLDLSFCNPVFIEWIPPAKKETLQQYALRLNEQIKEPNPILVGVSFGGMLTTEILKNNPTAKGILISSNKTIKEFPSLLLTGKYFPVYKWVPLSLLKKVGMVSRLFFGPKEKEKKKVFRQIFNDSDTAFTKWAIESILHWKNKDIPTNVVHIHGTADRLLPYKLVKADYTIKKGTHLMIMNNAEEISILLKKLI